MDPIVIAGSGLAGYTLAREFRKLDPAAPLVMVTADGGDFYAKPMLSNALAQGKNAADLVNASGAAMAAKHGITLHSRTTISAIDSAARKIVTASGTLAYRRLVLALGADPIRLPLGGAAAAEVLSVNDLDDYAHFRSRLDGHRHVALIGAGLIGCEFANDLAAAGYRVTVIDPAPYPLAGLLPEAAARRVRHALQEAGVGWIFGRSVTAVDGAAGNYRLALSDGSELAADLVLSAVGLRPRTSLAQAAGLETNRGICVDACLRTSAADIYAIGDCAEIGGQVRPYVPPIMHAARALAATLAGTPTAVDWPVMPVVVKTPACPVAAHPVARDAAGDWHEEAVGAGLRLRFARPDGQLAGFALVGAEAVAERASLASSMAVA
jgi:rubredoxin-NAD+ reductase